MHLLRRPGHGLTPAPPTLSFESHLDEIDAVVDHFGLPRDRLALIGASFGGAVASGTPACAAAAVPWWASTVRR